MARPVKNPARAVGTGDAPAAGCRVLSIQSHTVYGYVGNKAATFPLQLLGADVDPILSVQFSNHTGYPTFQGEVLGGESLLSIVSGMEANHLLDECTHVLTGYIGSGSFANAVSDVVMRARAKSGSALYACDPVLGDEGRLYVPQELVAVFRDRLLPLADVVLPNAFEAEQLLGQDISSFESIKQALDKLHSLGPSVVVMTSANLRDGEITLAASTTKEQEAGFPSRFTLSLPRMDAHFTGAGDLLSSLVVGWLSNREGRLSEAIEQAVNGLQATLRRTANMQSRDKASGTDPSIRVRSKELRLIQSQAEIVSPPPLAKVEPL